MNINNNFLQNRINSFYFFLILCLGLIIFLISAHLYTYYLVHSNQDRIINLSFINSQGNQDDLDYRLLSESDPKFHQFTTSISRSKLDKLAGDNYIFLIYRLAGQGYKVYVNGQLQREVGDLTTGRANIWNYMSYFNLETEDLQPENTVTIEVYGDYNIGLLTFPIMIMGQKLGNKLLLWFKFFLEAFNLIIIGALFTAGLLVIFIYSLSKEMSRRYIYYAVTAVCMLIGILDYLPLYSLPISYLMFKQIIMLSICLASFFMSLAIYRQFGNRLNLVLGYSLLAVILFSIITTSTVLQFHKRWTLILVVQLSVFINWMYTTLLNFKTSYEARVLFLSSLLTVIDVVAMWFVTNLLPADLNYDLNVIPFRFFVFAMAIIILVILRYINLQREIAYQQAHSELMYQRAIKDGMTDTYNHQYVINTLEDETRNYSLLMIDIDDFKRINDNYGHQAGDEVIQYAADTIKAAVRDCDLVGRYGGDEFVAVLFNCRRVETERIAQRVKKQIEGSYQLTKTDRSVEISISMGVNVVKPKTSGQKALAKADQALYQAKEQGKSTISIYK